MFATRRARGSLVFTLLLGLGASACGGGNSGGSSPPVNPATGTGGKPGSGGTPGGGTGGTGGTASGGGGGSSGQGGTAGTPAGSDGAAPAPGPDAGDDTSAPADTTPPPPADAAPGGAAAVLEDPLPACRQTVQVADSGALAPALAAAKPGHCLVLGDGNYTFPTITVTGSPEAPIIIRAANRGKATVSTGNITVMGSSHLAIEGLLFTSGGSIRFEASPYTRLTRTRITPTGDQGGAWVNLLGKTHHARIDHNDMGPKTAAGNMVQTGVDVPGQVVQYIRIDHNYFHDVRYGGGNGWETIRAGYSHVAPSKGYIIIEQNLFRATSGDPETISVKSSDAIVRFNTIRDTNGQICLRHGNRTLVHGNFMFKSGSGNSGAIRVYGADHKIFNNYLENSGGINLAAGSAPETDVGGTEHYRVYRAEVVNNTIIGAGVSFAGGGMPAMGCTVANNLSQGGGIGAGGQGSKIMNNMTDGAGMTQTNGLWKLAAGSAAIDASIEGFPYVMDDIDGQKRLGKPDLGADELSTEAVLRGPLAEKDVGPDAP